MILPLTLAGASLVAWLIYRAIKNSQRPYTAAEWLERMRELNLGVK